MHGLLGKTLKHSFSKKIHESLGTSYELLETDDLSHFFESKDFDGINITIPYKQDVISYCDVIDPLVKRTNSCNTIVKKDGLLYAYNTDYTGFKESLSFHQIAFEGETIAIIGNGATSRTISALAEDLGAEQILVFARHPKDNEYLIDRFNDYNDISIMINTTPVGMYPNIDDSLPCSLTSMKNLKIVIDVIYNPLKTTLLLEAEDAGLQTMNGLHMLVAQAAKSYELFHHKQVSSKQILSLYRVLKKEQSNIVFIGMPKSGKSLYSKIYAEKYHRELYDIDTLFEAKFHMTISKYFDQYKESSFRKEEQAIIKEVSSYSGVIISTGGGAILNKDNVTNLKHNGIIVFIDAPLEILKNTKTLIHRPLLQNDEALENLYKKRYQIYLDTADIVLKKQTLHTSTNINALEALLYEYFGT